MSVTQSLWPRAIYTTAQVRSFDRQAIDHRGIAGFELMRRAGAAALEFLRARWPDVRAPVIYCGAGNNAGDGFVLAALASAAGLSARVVTVFDPAALQGDAALALAMARDAGITIDDFDLAGPEGADLVVDALLGTGLTRAVDGRLAEAVARINTASLPVLALDVPTGLDSDTGAIRGVAVEADATMTFVGLKSGLYLGSGPARRGQLGFSDLGLPADVYGDAPAFLHRSDASDTGQLLSPRSRIAHKGMNGRILVVGGAAGMAGAARLAAEAALRAGAGLVHAAVAPESVGAVMAGRPEIMCRGVSQPDDFGDWTEVADVIVVGPGLGLSTWGEALARAMLATNKPLVVDADALNYLAAHKQQRGNWVLTPHPGEAGRLLGSSSATVQAGRDVAAGALARDFDAVAVLKGACSLVAQVTEKNQTYISVCDYGNPGMASGGMGDLLSGVTGALIGQFGLSVRTVECAVLVHALAGDDAARDGERGLVASDLLPYLRRRVNPG